MRPLKGGMPRVIFQEACRLASKHELVVELAVRKRVSLQARYLCVGPKSYIRGSCKSSGCQNPLLLERDRYTRCSKCETDAFRGGNRIDDDAIGVLHCDRGSSTTDCRRPYRPPRMSH